MTEVTTRRRHQKVTYQRSTETSLVSKMLSLGASQERIVSDMEKVMKRESFKLTPEQRQDAKNNKKTMDGLLKPTIADQVEELRQSVKLRVVPSMHRKLDRLVDMFVEQLIKECLDKPEGLEQDDSSTQEQAPVISPAGPKKITPDQNQNSLPSSNGVVSEVPKTNNNMKEKYKITNTSKQSPSAPLKQADPNPVKLKPDPQPVKPQANPEPIKRQVDPQPIKTHADPEPSKVHSDSEPIKLQSIKSRMKAFEQLGSSQKAQHEQGPRKRPISLIDTRNQNGPVINGVAAEPSDPIGSTGSFGDDLTRPTSRTSSLSSVFSSGSSLTTPSGDKITHAEPESSKQTSTSPKQNIKRSESSSSSGSSKGPARFSVSWDNKSQSTLGKVKVSEIDKQQDNNDDLKDKVLKELKAKPKTQPELEQKLNNKISEPGLSQVKSVAKLEPKKKKVPTATLR